MALKYDFEMFTVIPEDQQIRVEAEGLPRELAGRKIALFRDPLTAAALRKASRTMFRPRFPGGRVRVQRLSTAARRRGGFPEEDAQDRDRVLTTVWAKRWMSVDLETADFGGFDLNDFLDHLHSASPIEVEELSIPTIPAAVPVPRSRGSGVSARPSQTVMAVAVSTVF